MKFRLIETENLKQNIDTIEKNSNLQIEFHIYSSDRKNPLTDQYIVELEQRISAFGSENTENTDENNNKYSMFRITGIKFKNTTEIANFFQIQFKDFINLLNSIWKNSNNSIRVLIIDDSNPPIRIPGRIYILSYNSDYNNMILSLKAN